MKVYVYARVSTDKQTLDQQMNTVNQHLKSKGLSYDEVVADEDVSGCVSYKKRKLYGLLERMVEGDVLVVSEISRLSRSMCDLSNIINVEMKTRKLRLIIIKMGIDLNCAEMKAIDEMILNNFAFAAQLERELICDRTQSEIDVIQNEIATTGQHTTRKGKHAGRVVTHLGRDKGCDLSVAQQASAEARRNRARLNPHNEALRKYIENFEKKRGIITKDSNISDIVDDLNALGFKTATGLEFNPKNFWTMMQKVKRLYAA
jgi:DNA invertase Pin-like site-specific DNA recombinase